MSHSQEPKQSQRSPLVTIGALIVVALIAFFLWQNGSLQGVQAPEATQAPASNDVAQQASPDAASTEPSNEEAAANVAAEPYAQVSDLPPIAYAELPPEAHDTIELIDSGGPFPFDKDGSTFQNREGILPDRDQGYYAEYTVITPGSDDRGARRIVGGDDGELYYTDDHYASFKEIIR